MDEIDWARYALDYDAMCEANPAYQENIQLLKDRVGNWQLSTPPQVLDIGAGTGNYISVLGDILVGARFTHLDSNALMNTQALIKYRLQGLKVEVIQNTLRDALLAVGSQDLVICVNALYAMPHPHAMLRKIRRVTKRGGKLFIIDFGRPMDVGKWSMFMLKSLVKQHGARGALAWFWRYREVLKQNRIGLQAQRQGSYWLHSPTEFADALERTGWHIEEIATCYQGYCDLAVCRAD